MPTMVIDRKVLDFNKPVIPQDFIQYLFFVFGGVLVYNLPNAQGIFVKFDR